MYWSLYFLNYNILTIFLFNIMNSVIKYSLHHVAVLPFKFICAANLFQKPQEEDLRK